MSSKRSWRTSSRTFRTGTSFAGAFNRNRDSGPAFIVVVLVSAAVYAVSWLLLQALSRYREFAADRG